MGDERSFNSRSNVTTLEGKIVKPKGSVDYSQGQRELSEDGYTRYNIDEEDGIYIAKVPERALFNDGEPVFVKAQSGVFVGTRWHTPEDEFAQRVTRRSTNPNDLFGNVQRGADYQVRTHVGTYEKGKVVEQKPITDFVSRINDRMMRTGSSAYAGTSLTSSAAETQKMDMTGVNTDNVAVKPVDKPRTQKKFVFKDGKLVPVEVQVPRIDLETESKTVSQ